MGAVAASAITKVNSVHSYVEKASDVATGGSPRFKVGYIFGGATVDATNTIEVDIYAKWGMTKFLGFKSYRHTTANQLIIPETDTTAVINNTLTLTISAGADNKIRMIAVYGI